MKSYPRLGCGKAAIAWFIALAVALLTGAPAQAAVQYDLDCSVCHRMPPLDAADGEREPESGAFKGNHQSHAGTGAASCVKCHGPEITATDHENGVIQLLGTFNGSPGAAYSRGTFFNQTSVPPQPLGTCSNVNCHFNRTTPEWGSEPLGQPYSSSCGTCHSALPASNAHSAHLTRYGNELAVCERCHTDHTAEGADAFQHATSAGRRPVEVRLPGAGRYAAPVCSDVYCHSPGQSASAGALRAADYARPDWGNKQSGACGSCHATLNASSGSHASHLAAGNDCGACHAGTSATATNPATHADGVIDVALSGYSKGGEVTPGQGFYGSCASASCHASPYRAEPLPSPVWGTPTGCAACHKLDGGVDGSFDPTTGAPNTGSHRPHLFMAGATCSRCHEGAVKNVSGGASHANGTVEVTNDYSGTPVAKHAPGSYTGTCSSAACHASPYGATPTESPVWGTTSGCASCHNGAGAFTAGGAPDTGSHAAHMSLGASCNQCHSGAIHTNGTVEVSAGYTASPVKKHPIGTYTGTCTNAFCHNDGTGRATPTPLWGQRMPDDCSGCHGGAAGASVAMASGRHGSHMNNYSTLGRGNNLSCAECHARTVSAGSDTKVTTVVNHLNGFKDYSGARAGRQYSADDGVCSNVYCHSSGQSAPVFRSMTGSKGWRGSARLDCNGCHGRASNASWSGGLGAPNYPSRYDGTLATANSHQVHTAGMTDSRACAKCHLNTVNRAAANRMRDYSSHHLDGKRDVAFQLFGNYSAAGKSCATYCHSNVQAPGGFGSASYYARPAWGDNNLVGSAGECASCHADMASLGENPAALSLGSHKRHAVDAGYSCSLCHGTGYGSREVAGSTHADGRINLSFTGKAAGNDYSSSLEKVPGSASYGDCSNSACHGRAPIRSWGLNTSVPTCEKCHGSANTAINSRVFTDTAGNQASPYAGSHVSHLAGPHNIANPVACDECHQVPASVTSFGHMSSLPARLVWGPLATANSFSGGVFGAPMVPSYSNQQCANTYCHAGARKPDGSAQGSGANPTWGDPSYLGGNGCDKCHDYPPAYPHLQSGNCSACHNSVAPSNVTFADKSKHMNRVIEVNKVVCLDCHSSYNSCQEGDPSCVNKKLIGAHMAHTDADYFLAGKTLLDPASYGDISWIYSVTYQGGSPKFACGYCHPMDIGSHRNGVVQLDMDPSHSMAGTVKTRNQQGGPWVVAHDTGVSVVCDNVYCHSNGYVTPETNRYRFQQTPDWYAVNAWAGLDKCSQCHGNSPNTGGKEGSAAHVNHPVGIHYKDLYDNYSGKMAPAGPAGSGAAHGDPATSTTITCNICHYQTVTAGVNDRGSACASCHNAAGSGGLKGGLALESSGTSHINGTVDVSFITPFSLRSKAQLREGVQGVQSVYTSWTRVKGFKTYSSYELARTAPSYIGGTCSTVACHNGTQMEWGTKGPLSCAACHTGLPR